MTVPKRTLIKNVTTMRNKAMMILIFTPFVGRTYIEGSQRRIYLSDRPYRLDWGKN